MQKYSLSLPVPCDGIVNLQLEAVPVVTHPYTEDAHGHFGQKPVLGGTKCFNKYRSSQSCPESELPRFYFVLYRRFPYLDRPEERHILEALKELYQCDAIDR